MPNFNPLDWITTNEAAELTGYSPVTMRQFAREGKIKSLKLGRDWFLNRESVLAYKQQMEELGTAKHDPWRTGARQREDNGAE
jgi:excisionase family DNA binding protein